MSERTGTAPCPDRAMLRAYLDLDLAPTAEAAVDEHVRACSACGAILEESEPSWIFATLEPRTLPEPVWDEVHRAVRAEIARHPRAAALRPRWHPLSWLVAPRLVPAAVGLALVVLAIAFPGSERPAMLSPAALADNASMEAGFVYLSNREAEVTHLLVPGKDGAAPVKVTLVVDERIEDLF